MGRKKLDPAVKLERKRASSRKYAAATRDRKAEYDREYVKHNRAAISAKTIAWHRRNPLQTAIITIHTRAKKKDLPFDLTESWLEEKLKPGVCELTGMKLYMGNEPRHPHKWSVDRIDSRNGYLTNNCRIVSLHVNLALSNYGELELHRLAAALMVKKLQLPATITLH